ncbi:MAG: putative two-component system response regulator [Gemmataceae bacterium]|nr:putative two-component system response regulator [Gemmataceae bacterium]
MTSITTLLVTQNPSVIRDIQQLHDNTEFARLEVCGRFEKVSLRGNTLLLVHSDPSVDPKRVRTLLEAADRMPVTAAVLWRPAEDRGARVPEFGPHPVYQLPGDLPTIRNLLAETGGSQSQGGHAPSPGPIDPITATLLGSDMADQLARIRRVASQTATILLTGETGSGKSMMTKFIHANSPRRDRPYLVVDCGALSEHLIESEIFGHVRGAFTGAERERQGKFAASGEGTLVLDEINSLPLPLQVKLLRAVEERVFEPVGSNRSEPLRARLVAASNVPLEEAVRLGRFRADLFYRLNVVAFHIPPLRDRPGAVIPLARELLRTSETAACQGVTAIAPAALEVMVGYQWPGNVRELRNVIEGASALARGPVIQLADLPESIRGRSTPAVRRAEVPPSPPPGAASAPPRPDEAVVVDGGDEATRILAVLRKHNNNRRRAASELGMSRPSLYKKLHKSGVFVPKQRVPTAI